MILTWSMLEGGDRFFNLIHFLSPENYSISIKGQSEHSGLCHDIRAFTSLFKNQCRLHILILNNFIEQKCLRFLTLRFGNCTENLHLSENWIWNRQRSTAIAFKIFIGQCLNFLKLLWPWDCEVEKKYNWFFKFAFELSKNKPEWLCFCRGQFCRNRFKPLISKQFSFSSNRTCNFF